MAQTPGQLAASQAVAAEMARREWNIADLVKLTSADPGTIGDFINGNRWPKLGTQGKIEKALTWPPGTIRSISLGGPLPAQDDGSVVRSVGPEAETEFEFLTRVREDLTDEEMDQLMKEATPYLQMLMRDIKARRD